MSFHNANFIFKLNAGHLCPSSLDANMIEFLSISTSAPFFLVRTLILNTVHSSIYQGGAMGGIKEDNMIMISILLLLLLLFTLSLQTMLLCRSLKNQHKVIHILLCSPTRPNETNMTIYINPYIRIHDSTILFFDIKDYEASTHIKLKLEISWI